MDAQRRVQDYLEKYKIGTLFEVVSYPLSVMLLLSLTFQQVTSTTYNIHASDRISFYPHCVLCL